MTIETVDIHISPQHINTAAAQHEALLSILRYNDELRRQTRGLAGLNDISASRMELLVRFMAGVRCIAEYLELPWRATDAHMQRARDMRQKARELHDNVHQMMHTYVPLEVAFPEHWDELTAAVDQALRIIDFEIPEGAGTTSVAAAFKTWFGLEGAQAQSVQVEVKQALAQNLCALQEQLARSPGAERIVTRTSRALERWRGLNDVQSADDVFEVLLTFGNLVSSLMGNMPDMGDSLALGLLRLDTYRAMTANQAGRQEAFERLVGDLARASQVDEAQLRTLLTVNGETTAAQQRQRFADATELLEPRFHTGFRLSLMMTGLSALQLLSALAACSDPSEAELRDWINLGMSATFTGLDLVVTVQRGLQIHVNRAAMGLATVKTGAAWIPAVSRMAVFIGSAVGVAMGICDVLDGAREGSTLRVASGIANVISSLAFTVSAGAEIVAAGAAAGTALAATATTVAAIASGIGIVFAAAGLLIGIILDGMERAENLREAPSAALALIIAAVLGDESQTGVALVGPRVHMSAAERQQEARWQQWAQVFTPEQYARRGPEPPRPRETRPLIALLDRGANTNFEEKLREIRGLLMGATHQRILGGTDVDYDVELRTMVVSSESARTEILNRLNSLGIRRTHAITTRMVRVG